METEQEREAREEREHEAAVAAFHKGCERMRSLIQDDDVLLRRLRQLRALRNTHAANLSDIEAAGVLIASAIDEAAS